MPRTFSAALVASKNSLETTQPWAFLVQLDIAGAGPFRVAGYSQDITFQGNVFTAFPIKVNSLEENSSGQIRRMQVSTANVDQQIVALLELFWASVTDPVWTVSIWMVDATQPNETPATMKDVYTVVSATTDLFLVTFDLQWEGVTLTRRIPSRRYTRSGGFDNIPQPSRLGVGR